MRKNISFLAIIISLMLIFGLAMALTNCEPQKAEIRVTNSSQFNADDVVRVSVLMAGRSDALQTENLSRNQSVTFSLDAGEYRVRVTSGAGSSFWYPQDGTVINMSGDVRLNFNGNTLRRTN